jgi:hypothetical protein
MEKGIDNSQQRAQKQMRCDVAVVVNRQMGVLVGLLCWCKQQGKCFVEAWGRRRHFFDRSPPTPYLLYGGSGQQPEIASKFKPEPGAMGDPCSNIGTCLQHFGAASQSVRRETSAAFLKVVNVDTSLRLYEGLEYLQFEASILTMCAI